MWWNCGTCYHKMKWLRFHWLRSMSTTMSLLQNNCWINKLNIYYITIYVPWILFFTLIMPAILNHTSSTILRVKLWILNFQFVTFTLSVLQVWHGRVSHYQHCLLWGHKDLQLNACDSWWWWPGNRQKQTALVSSSCSFVHHRDWVNV
jgi:hypothetical protein